MSAPTDPAVPARRLLVAGRVQGVGFRAWTVDVATELGVTGFARNLPDGRVEIIASGSTVALDALEKRVHAGPPGAAVSQVERGAGALPLDIPAGRFVVLR